MPLSRRRGSILSESGHLCYRRGMTKKRLTIVVACVLGLIILWVALQPERNEPKHKSRKFSFWIQGIKLANRDDRSVRAALEIGRPAVPYLVEEIRKQDSLVRRSSLYAQFLKRLPNWAKSRVHPPLSAAGTIPALAYTLGCLGPEAGDAIPTLVKIADDRDRSIRYCAVWALGQIGSSAEARSAISLRLKDADTGVREQAKRALATIEFNDKNVARQY